MVCLIAFRFYILFSPFYLSCYLSFRVPQLRATDDNIGRARGLLRSIQRRIATNKCIMVIIILVLLGTHCSRWCILCVSGSVAFDFRSPARRPLFAVNVAVQVSANLVRVCRVCIVSRLYCIGIIGVIIYFANSEARTVSQPALCERHRIGCHTRSTAAHQIVLI